MANRVQRGFWRALEAVGVKNARRRWEGQSPILQRAVPPLVIATIRAPRTTTEDSHVAAPSCAITVPSAEPAMPSPKG